jgi:hypothetical protein
LGLCWLIWLAACSIPKSPQARPVDGELFSGWDWRGHGDISDRFLLFEYQDADQPGMRAVHKSLHAKNVLLGGWGP